MRTTGAALKSLGLNIADCDGILVTHEHSDHVKGLSTFLKKNPLPVYGGADTLDFLDANGIVPPTCELNTLSGREEDIGAFGVQAFPHQPRCALCGLPHPYPGRKDHDPCYRPGRPDATGA